MAITNTNEFKDQSVPTLKLIDFGIARRTRVAAAAIQHNLYQATVVSQSEGDISIYGPHG